MKFFGFAKNEFTYRGYVLGFLFLFFVLGTLFSGFNLIVDPYDVYDVVELDAFKNKPQVNGFTRYHKTQKLLSNTYACVFLGSSRVEGAFDEIQEPTFRELCPTYYNAGINGVNILEVYHLLRISAKYAKAKVIFYGMDLLQFNAKGIQPDAFEMKVYRNPWVYRYLLLISKNTFLDSLKTIHAKQISFYKDNGAWLILENYKDKFLPNVRIHDLFLLNEKAFYDNFYSDFSFETKTLSSFAIYRDILTFLHENQLKAFIFINPFHVRLLEIEDLRIGYEQSEFWKKELVKIHQELSEEFQQEPIPLWDFSGYNEITTEEITHEKNTVKYYFIEGSHINHQVGELIIKKMLTHNPKEPHPDFGYPLTIENIDSYLREQRKKQEYWRKHHQNTIQEIKAFVGK
ncbi:MAG: hypothetical protein NZ853_10495 [Leptospiraceae bacterium]|nr:hypothetical protein [Leptospiraceae bacterium]MDW7977118.1 hypothetical protein [Leptospiraceae bacterium]